MLSRAICSTVKNYGRSMSTFTPSVYHLVRNDIKTGSMSHISLIKFLTTKEASKLLKIQKTRPFNIYTYDLSRKMNTGDVPGFPGVLVLMSAISYWININMITDIIYRVDVNTSHFAGPLIAITSMITIINIGVITPINYYILVPGKIHSIIHSAIYRYKLKKVIKRGDRV